MKRIGLWILGITLFWACSRTSSLTQTASVETVTPRRLEVLFLGDNGHHRPIDRVPEIMEALGSKGINFTYTDKITDLNPGTLGKYDALMLYANWDSIAPSQANALLDFVAQGKGFLPIHCASYCFRNNPEVVKLIGGQFWRHTMDTIQPVWTKPEHPVMAGVNTFNTWDETYLHEKLQPDNIILTERVIQADQAKDKPGKTTEPYTWVRTHGKGRVFYTAYGHDERTWSKPEFHKLLENGILWAVNEDTRKAHAALNPQPLAYREAKLPNYEQRPGQQLQQLPLSPEESVKHIQIPVDFTLDVFAHEPDVMHPIALSWDERGRLYVLITKDYPNERKQTGGSDYILICEDTNKDGKADKFTRFAEGLSIPTGMAFAHGGLVVSQAPHMLFLQDTDGDDKADVKKILFSGFGTFDTHAGPSNLHYGFDNWVYGAVGYSGFKGKFGDKDSLNFGQALFRFRPDGSDMEIMTKTSNNTWGLGFNEAGDLFGSTANNSHGWYMAIPNRYFGESKVDNGGRGTDTHKDMKPITAKVRQVDVFGGFTAAAGHNFYTARAFPKKYWNSIAFVSEPTGHVLHQNNMVKQGTDFQDSEAFNLLAGADEWVSPVFAEVGPDGAVWVADWYSYIIQHNPTPRGFDNGKGNAYDTDLRDFTHGRLYRIGWKNAPAYTPIALSKDRPEELVATLKNTNMLWRMHAQRLLVEREGKDVVPQLVALVKNTSVDEVGLNTAAIHALWTLHGLGAITDDQVLEAATGALRHPSAAVRKTAVQVLPKTAKTAEALLQVDALHDTEPLVVLNSLLAFTDIPLSPAVENAVLARIDEYKEADDRWLPDAFAVVMNAHNGAIREKYLAKRVASAGTNTSVPAKMAIMDHAGMDHLQPMATEKQLVEGKPDLVISNVTVNPTSPYVREYARITLHITNMGTVTIPQEKVPVVTVSVRGSGLDINYISRKLNKGIAPGETIMLSEGNNGPWNAGFGFMAEQAGKVNITATIDQDNVVEEANERNNVISKTFEVKRPQSMSDFAMERASRGFASYATADEVLDLLKTSQKLDADGKFAVTKGVLGGWNTKRNEKATPAVQEFLVSLNKDISTDLSKKMTAFMESFGIKDMEMEDPEVQVITIKAIREAMKYDKTEFTVVVGKTVVIVFENPDAMQHNLVVGKPKTMEIIGAAADKMITAKDGAEKNYVPDIPQIIAATPLVNPDQTYRLKFTAPAAGEYPYVCTFPGHWRLMKGVMKVVKQDIAQTAK
jgi:putative membrane-bound dehydrogenase-like protein